MEMYYLKPGLVFGALRHVVAKQTQHPAREITRCEEVVAEVVDAELLTNLKNTKAFTVEYGTSHNTQTNCKFSFEIKQ